MFHVTMATETKTIITDRVETRSLPASIESNNRLLVKLRIKNIIDAIRNEVTTTKPFC